MKILVLFVEPMLYGMDQIHEVYEKTSYQFQYIYCHNRLTGKDDIDLPENSFVCNGEKKERKEQIIKIFREYNPDFTVINGYVGTEQTCAIHYCQKNKIPYAIESDTPLNIPGNKLKAIAKKLVLKRRLKNSLCCGFPGGTLQKENLVHYGIPENRNYIMPMSVSIERLRKAAEQYANKDTLKKTYGLKDKKVFLFVGRLAKEKNISLLIEAFGHLKEEYANAALVIVGDGEQKNVLKTLAGETKDICFVGYSIFPDLIQYYKMADIFVLPSSYEPWGLVVNEAMTMGLPVVVSSAVGCRVDLVKDGENGFVFRSGDVADLKRKMENFMNKDILPYLDEAKKTIAHWNYGLYLKNFRRVVGNVEKQA